MDVLAKQRKKSSERPEELAPDESATHEQAPAPPEPQAAAEPARPAAPVPAPWFGDPGSLGIAGAARRPGAPGTNVVARPEVRVIKVERPALRSYGEERAARAKAEPKAEPAAAAPASAPAAPAVVARPRPAPVATAVPAPAVPKPEPVAKLEAAAAPAEAASAERPVVRVSIAQAAAAGNQTLRPLAPTVRTSVPTVARPAATPAAAQREVKRREVAPAVPLALPDADATFLAVHGLGTPSCVARVERLVRGVPGVSEVEANLAAGLVAVAPSSIGRAAVEAALADAGHPADPAAPNAAEAKARARKLALSAGATAGVAIAAHVALRLTGSPVVGAVVTLLALATAWSVVGPALRHLVRGRLSAELLPLAATLAILAASLLSPGPSAALAVFPLVAHLAVAALATLGSARALRLIEELRAVLPTGDAPKPGSRVEVGAGEVIPADGRLIEPAILDERPVGGDDDVERLIGESVAAGAIATNGAVIKIEPTAGRSRVARGLRVAERALATHPTGTISQVASRLVVPVALVAAIAAGWTSGLWAAAAVLAGAAPLALGLAGSLASAAGVTRAAQRGVAVRSSEALERAGRTRVVLLDKSTTLTRGDAAVLELLVKPGRDPRQVLAAAAAVQHGVDHGIARALTAHARDLHVDVPEAKDRRYEQGLGTVARVDGREVVVGSAHFAVRSGVDLGLLVQTVDELARRGRTPLVVAEDGEAVAVMGIADTPRESARQAMGSLELLDLDIHVASGDAAPAVQWLAEAIGLDKRVARGDLSPEAKKALVQELRADGPTLVAGASAVDVEALAAADLAVAAGSGPAVEAAAGALLVRQDPQGVVELVRAGRATRRGRALATAAGLAGNAAAMTLAATGELGVAGAAILGLCASLLSLGAAASPWVRIR